MNRTFCNKYPKTVICLIFVSVLLISAMIAFLLLKFEKESSSRIEQTGITLGLSETFVNELHHLDEDINNLPASDDKNEKIESLKAELEEKYPTEWKCIKAYEKGYSDGYKEGIKNGVAHERWNSFLNRKY